MFILSYVDDLLIIGEESEVSDLMMKSHQHQQGFQPQAHHSLVKWNLDSLPRKEDAQKVTVSHRDLNDGQLHEVSV
eukprot:4218873-Amphidinium_carterae.1